MTRKQVDKLVGQSVVFVSKYGDQFHAMVRGNRGRWNFEAEYVSSDMLQVGLFARDDFTEFHPL